MKTFTIVAAFLSVLSVGAASTSCSCSNVPGAKALENICYTAFGTPSNGDCALEDSWVSLYSEMCGLIKGTSSC
ncbi:hypothetical protein T439DRAFT_328831 [Meredithblackwellia eburnea MCA 4105]